MWEYLKDPKVYHCPLHDAWTEDVPDLWSRVFTSYMMNGVVNDFAYNENADVSTRRLFRMGRMPSDGILISEQDEGTGFGGWGWNDGANFPDEAIANWGARHQGRAAVVSFDGSAQQFYKAEAQALAAQANGRFWCCPVHADGH